MYLFQIIGDGGCTESMMCQMCRLVQCEDGRYSSVQSDALVNRMICHGICSLVVSVSLVRAG